MKSPFPPDYNYWLKYLPIEMTRAEMVATSAGHRGRPSSTAARPALPKRWPPSCRPTSTVAAT